MDFYTHPTVDRVLLYAQVNNNMSLNFGNNPPKNITACQNHLQDIDLFNAVLMKVS